MNKNMKIKTRIGGPCIYKYGEFDDGTETGCVEYIGQSNKEMERELFDTLKTGRDDVRSFVNRVFLK